MVIYKENAVLLALALYYVILNAASFSVDFLQKSCNSIASCPDHCTFIYLIVSLL